MLDEFTDRFMVNTATNKVIKKYSYKVENGLITFPKNHLTNIAYDGTSLVSMNGYGLTKKNSHQINNALVGNYVSLLGPATEAANN